MTLVCRSSQSLLLLKTVAGRRCGPYIPSTPGHRINSGVVKLFNSSLNPGQYSCFGSGDRDVLMQGHLLELGIPEDTMKHVRLLVVMRGEHDVVGDVF